MSLATYPLALCPVPLLPPPFSKTHFHISQKCIIEARQKEDRSQQTTNDKLSQPEEEAYKTEK
jgi:hypothetical protein